MTIRETAIGMKVRIETLAAVNEVYLTKNPKTPKLYDSGLRISLTGAKVDRPLLSIPVVMEQGAAELDELVAYRLAELHAAGETKAQARVVWTRTGNAVVLTPMVRRADGSVEDVAQALFKKEGHA